jgi:hypothetical protein
VCLRTSIHVYVCARAHVYTCTRACKYTYMHVSLHLPTRVYTSLGVVCVCVCVHTRVCVRARACVHQSTCVYVRVYTCLRVSLCVRVCTHVQTRAVNACTRARTCRMSTHAPFHLSLLLHPNLEFFIPELPRCVLFEKHLLVRLERECEDDDGSSENE